VFDLDRYKTILKVVLLYRWKKYLRSG